MAHVYSQIPEQYHLLREIDLQKDKKTALFVNVLAGVVMVIMAFVMNAFIPFVNLFDMSAGFVPYILRFVVIVIGLILYIILHELTHAAVMKHYGAPGVKFGFTGLYAFAGSPDAYFDRRSYLRVSLAPLIVWGIVFAILCAISGQAWFWVFWTLQIVNVSGAAGDVYVSVLCLRMPDTILINDDGVSMRFYDR